MVSHRVARQIVLSTSRIDLLFNMWVGCFSLKASCYGTDHFARQIVLSSSRMDVLFNMCVGWFSLKASLLLNRSVFSLTYECASKRNC